MGTWIKRREEGNVAGRSKREKLRVYEYKEKYIRFVKDKIVG